MLQFSLGFGQAKLHLSKMKTMISVRRLEKGIWSSIVKNLTGEGAYNGFNEIRWMQKEGRFSDLFGTKTCL